MIDVPQYQAKIPISGGGGFRGNIDLTERFDENPIVQALMLMQQLKRQKRQDELQEGMQGQIVTEGGKTWIVDKRTGQKIDLGIKASPKVEELLKMMDVARKYEEPTETETAIGESAGQELLGLRGLEKYEIPGEKRSRLGMDFLAGDIPPRTGVRKKVEGKVRPPITIGKEPKTVQEFESEVKRLGKVDIKKARAYYDKWAGKWK